MSFRRETMARHVPLASWILVVLFLQLTFLSAQGREVPKSDKDVYDITENRVDNHLGIYDEKKAKHTEAQSKGRDGHSHSGHRQQHHDMDPSVHIFFTLEDLKIGKTMPLYFPGKPDPSKIPRLLPRDDAETIPFSSSQLPSLLGYFSFSKQSPQAKAMAYTLKQCELEPIEGEVKFCATSLESMLDRVHQVLRPGTESRALATTYLSVDTAKPLQNYTILETPKQVAAPKMVGCHLMPYPYAVFYCHSQLQSENRLFQVSVGGPNGERVDAVAVCHMDTSKWNIDHASFQVLNIEPGSSPVCHFFPVDNLIWVPVQSSRV